MNRAFDKIIRSIGMSFSVAQAEFYRKRKAFALRSEMHQRALKATADFLEREAPNALYCKDPLTHLRIATETLPEGSILEFGVYRGDTLNYLAKRHADRELYGFDSFLGLPEAWAGNRASEANFNMDGKKPATEPNVTLVEGWFDKTLPGFLTTFEKPIAFVHIDCDIYSSTQCVLHLLGPRLRPGAVIAFDEFFNYPNFEQHEFKAFFEFVETFGVQFRYLAFSGQQLSVVIDAIQTEGAILSDSEPV